MYGYLNGLRPPLSWMISAGGAGLGPTHRHATAAAAAPANSRFSAYGSAGATQISVRALLMCKRTSRGASALCCKQRGSTGASSLEV